MTKDPYLLTPGPLTTAAETKAAMLHDWGSRDQDFIGTNARIGVKLVHIAGAITSHVYVPLQGSGTFIIEATLITLIPRGAKALVLVNGAYGRRMASILERTGRVCAVLETPEDQPNDTAALDAALAADQNIGHVLCVHCETTSGILNPIEAIAAVVAKRGRRLLIDAMSTFGALPINARTLPFEAVMASSNKCLEGVPGMGFSIIAREALEAAEGNAESLSLDLFDQWKAMEGNGQWRFTPPTHVIAALDKALTLFDAEGGQDGRLMRYRENCAILIDGMRGLGFETLLADANQAPIIVTFHMPGDKAFNFKAFYYGLKERGFVIYPGKLTQAPSFRMGCIGALGSDEMRSAIVAVKETLAAMGVKDGAP